MIDAIERQNNIRESIESTARLFELLENLSLIKYAKFTRSIESTIKNLRWLLENQSILVKQTSENNLFNLFLSSSRKLVNQASQNNLCRQINLVSLLQMMLS